MPNSAAFPAGREREPRRRSVFPAIDASPSPFACAFPASRRNESTFTSRPPETEPPASSEIGKRSAKPPPAGEEIRSMPPGSASDTAPSRRSAVPATRTEASPVPASETGTPRDFQGTAARETRRRDAFPSSVPGVGAEQPVGLQRPLPQFRVRPGETKDTAAQGELRLPFRPGGAGKPRVPEDETGRPFRIVPRTVGGGGELRLPLPDDAPHVGSPRSAGRDPSRDIQFPGRLHRRDPLPRVERTGEAKRGGIPCRLELPDAQDALLVGRDPPRPTETARPRPPPRAAPRHPPPVRGRR